jgi:hypothetical protein
MSPAFGPVILIVQRFVGLNMVRIQNGLANEKLYNFKFLFEDTQFSCHKNNIFCNFGCKNITIRLL